MERVDFDRYCCRTIKTWSLSFYQRCKTCKKHLTLPPSAARSRSPLCIPWPYCLSPTRLLRVCLARLIKTLWKGYCSSKRTMVHPLPLIRTPFLLTRATQDRRLWLFACFNPTRDELTRVMESSTWTCLMLR